MVQEKKTAPKKKRRRASRAAALQPSHSSWDPERDEALAASFSAGRPAGKAKCKAALQAELGLKARPRTPIFVYAGELEPAAGFDVVLDTLPALFKIAAQVVILAPRGAGLAVRAAAVARQNGERVALLVEDDERLLRRVLAGADVLLLPASSSAGLAWRGLRYGVLPVAMAGSAAATFVRAASTPAAAGSSRLGRGARGRVPAKVSAPQDVPGFFFRSASVAAFARAALKAAEAYREAVRWRRLRRAGLLIAQAPEEDDAGLAVNAPVAQQLIPRAASPVLTLAHAAHQFDAAPAAATAALAPEPPAEPYIDWGPPMPARYGEDALELLVQSPRRLYGYWEVSPRLYAKAGGAPRLELVLHDEIGQRPLSSQAGDFGDWWIDSEPGHSYQLELRSPGGAILLRSGRVKTPRENGSPHHEAQWAARPPAGGARAPAKAAGRAVRGRVAVRGAVRAAAGTAAGLEVGQAPAAGARRRPKSEVVAAGSAAPLAELSERRAPASEERPRRGPGSYPSSATPPPRGRK